MVRTFTTFSALALAAMLILTGCDNTKKDDKKSSLKDAPAYGEGDKKPGDKSTDEKTAAERTGTEKTGAGDTDDAAEKEIEIALASLSDEDRAAAEKQRDCPISGHRLGSMEAPVKVTLNGEEVFLCCEGCRPDAEEDPDGTLAKANK